jgi:hypothetical protein
MSAAAIVRPSSASRLNVEQAFRCCVIMVIVSPGKLGYGRAKSGRLTESITSSCIPRDEMYRLSSGGGGSTVKPVPSNRISESGVTSRVSV